jgi:hypothetical protein
MPILPNRDELAELRRALTEAGMKPEAEAVAIDAFTSGEWSAETVDS